MYINSNIIVKIISIIPLAYINSLLTLLIYFNIYLDNIIPAGIPIIIDVIHCIKACINQLLEISLYWNPKPLNIAKFFFWSNKLYEFILITIIFPIHRTKTIIITAGIVYVGIAIAAYIMVRKIKKSNKE